jgi:hypothetical protein
VSPRIFLSSLVLLLSACDCCAPAPEPTLDVAPLRVALTPLPSAPAAARVALIDHVKKTTAAVVVVALDGETLFNAEGRSRRIFLEVLAEMGQMDLMRSMAERVEQGAPLRNQADFIRASGIDDEKMLDLLKRRFNERLTSDAYIPDDQPRKGLSSFFRSLFEAGATLVYIGDDDLVRSGPGWVQLLRNNGLPVLAPRAYLMLPPKPGGADAAFISDRFETIAGLGEVLATLHVRKADGEALKSAFPKAHTLLMQPIGKSDRPGWLDFGAPQKELIKPLVSRPDAGSSVKSP